MRTCVLALEWEAAVIRARLEQTPAQALGAEPHSQPSRCRSSAMAVPGLLIIDLLAEAAGAGV